VGTGKAIIALARKFLGIIYRTLKNKWVFEDFPNLVLGGGSDGMSLNTAAYASAQQGFAPAPAAGNQRIYVFVEASNRHLGVTHSACCGE
jgi:hypothetical protein